MFSRQKGGGCQHSDTERREEDSVSRKREEKRDEEKMTNLLSVFLCFGLVLSFFFFFSRFSFFAFFFLLSVLACAALLFDRRKAFLALNPRLVSISLFRGTLIRPWAPYLFFSDLTSRSRARLLVLSLRTLRGLGPPPFSSLPAAHKGPFFSSRRRTGGLGRAVFF